MPYFERENLAVLYALIAVAIIIIWVFLHRQYKMVENFKQYTPNTSCDYNKNVAEELHDKPYTVDDVVPFITGQLYSRSRASGAGNRFVHKSDMSHEYKKLSPANTGDPLTQMDVFDDGIPENWRLPDVPIESDESGDHYDVSMGNVVANGRCLFDPQEPDHEPLFS